MTRDLFDPKELDIGFFDRSSTREAVNAVASCKSVTIFAGSGISADVEGPLWKDLISTLLVVRAQREGWIAADPSAFDAAVKEVVPSILQRGGAYGGSVLVELIRRQVRRPAEFTPNLANDLYAAIYPKDRSTVAASVARAVVRLAFTMRVRSSNVVIATTNYDNTLIDVQDDVRPERTQYAGLALEPIPTKQKLEEWKLLDARSRNIPVVYLNGYLPWSLNEAKAGGGSLVVGERDFFTNTVGGDWRRAFVLERLRRSGVLFVGTSLTDADTVRNLAATMPRRKPAYAIVLTDTPSTPSASRTQDKDSEHALAPELSHEYRVLLKSLTALRFSHFEVEAVQPDYKSQVPQFLSEVSSLVEAGGKQSFEYYSERLRRWWDEWRDARMNDEQARFRELQTVRREVERFLRLSRAEDVTELLKVEVWVRANPERREMVLWGHSEGLWHEDATLHRGHIAEASQHYAAVEAFREGKAVFGDLTSTGHRWQYYFSVPVILRGPWLRLPVGVMTVLSNLGIDKEGRLAKAVPLSRDSLSAMLHAQGERLLTPPQA